MLNDPAFIEAAEALARRLTSECRGSARDRITHGLRLCLAREPTEEETAVLARLFESERGAGQGGDDRAWNVVANVLLNLHATICKW
jgi:hypothetical protein